MFKLEEIKGAYAKNSSDYLLKHLKKILTADTEITYSLSHCWWAEDNKEHAKAWATELLIELIVKRNFLWSDIKRIIKSKRKNKN